MKLPDEDKALPDIARGFAPQLRAADQLFEYLQGLVNNVTSKANQRLTMCLSSVFTRLLRLHCAATKIATIGIASEAKLQVRA
ncbi:MAG: hypothetical protein KKE00_07990, partial [Proteobacteria bacterium]|nr:hypothetical protein [Pseudomonadota bacterium]